MDLPENYKLIGHVNVDSAQLVITDPLYLESWENDAYDSVSDDLNEAHFHPAPADLPYSFGGACAGASCSAKAAELNDGSGAVVSTGWGDGRYPVYVAMTEGRVDHVIIDFQVSERLPLIAEIMARQQSRGLIDTFVG